MNNVSVGVTTNISAQLRFRSEKNAAARIGRRFFRNFAGNICFASEKDVRNSDLNDIEKQKI